MLKHAARNTVPMKTLKKITYGEKKTMTPFKYRTKTKLYAL